MEFRKLPVELDKNIFENNYTLLFQTSHIITEQLNYFQIIALCLQLGIINMEKCNCMTE